MLELVTPVLIRRSNLTGRLLVLQDLLHLVRGVVRLGCEGALGHLHAQDVWHHVGSEPSHQRCAARGVVSLTVVEQEPVHLETGVKAIIIIITRDLQKLFHTLIFCNIES